MAVIRQQTQFLNRPVGVVRSSAGGGEMVGNAISETAGRFADIAFKKAAAEAEKKGTEKALAIESADLIKHDPITNKPVALTPPNGFGDIAAEAYQSIIQKRYGQAIEREIQNKGTELAKSAPSAAAYKKAMAEYVGSMYNAEADSTYYSNVVKEYGDNYVEETYATLRAKEIAAYRAKVKREAKIENVKDFFNIKARISAGETSPELEQSLKSWMSSARDSYLSGDGTISDLTDAYEMWIGFNGLKASNTLLSTFEASSNSFQENIKMALRDPTRADEYVGEETAKQIRTYLINDGTADAFIKIADAQEESMLNKIKFDADKFAGDNPIDASWSYDKLKEVYRDQPDQYKTEAMADLVMMKIEPSMTKDSIPTFIDELQAPVFKGENFPESVRSILKDMGAEERVKLADVFNQRKIAKTAVSEVLSEQKASDVQSALISLEESGDINDNFFIAVEFARRRINELDETKQRSQMQALDSIIANKLNTLVSDNGLSSDEMSDVNNAVLNNVRSLTGTTRPNGEPWTPAQKKYHSFMTKAYAAAPTVTSGAMSRRLEAKRENEKIEVDTQTLKDVESRISDGLPVSSDELKLAGDIKYKNRIPKIDEIVGNQEFLSRAASGNTYPQELKSIELSLKAADEVTQELGFNLFRKLTNVQQEVDGVVQSRDFLINKLPEDLYIKAKAAIDASDFAMNFGQKLNPVMVYGNLQRFDGSIDAVIRQKLDIPANQSLNNIFSKYEIPDMDLNTQRQFLAMIKYSAASGFPLNEQSMTTMVETMQKNMVEDPRVIGYRIGDKTSFSPNGIIDDAGQAKFNLDIFEELLSDPLTAPLLNLTEEEQNRGFTPIQKRLRMKDKVKLEPIEETWMEGKNKSWIVKMDNGLGGYVAPMPNGYPIIISEQDYKPLPTDKGLFYYTNQKYAAAHSGNPRAKAATEFQYFVFRDIEAYDTFESTSSVPGMDEYKQYLSEQQLKDLYNEVVNGQ